MNFSFLGTSPVTTIIGYIFAILQLIYPIISKPEFNWKTDWVFIISAALTAYMGRRTKQTDGVTPAEGFAIKQAIIAPEHEVEEVEEEPVKINEKVAKVAKANVTHTVKKKEDSPGTIIPQFANNGINFTGLIVMGAIVLIAFILGRCNGYSGGDEERLKLRDSARVEDSIRHVETQRAIDNDIADSIEASRMVDSAAKADRQAQIESDAYLEQERIYNKKIKDEIKNPNNSDVERIARIRLLLAKQRQLKQRQLETSDTTKQR